MYKVDEKDQVIELENVPQSSVGAPLPVLIGEEGKLVLAFYLQNTPEGWDGTTVRVINSNSEERLAIVEFSICYAHMFGPPDEGAFDGHPLADRGLKPFGAYEVLNSSWLRQLEQMNAIHEQHHEAERFWRFHHYIFAFHDSTFECVADGFEVTETYASMESTLPLMAEKLWTR